MFFSTFVDTASVENMPSGKKKPGFGLVSLNMMAIANSSHEGTIPIIKKLINYLIITNKLLAGIKIKFVAEIVTEIFLHSCTTVIFLSSIDKWSVLFY